VDRERTISEDIRSTMTK